MKSKNKFMTYMCSLLAMTAVTTSIATAQWNRTTPISTLGLKSTPIVTEGYFIYDKNLLKTMSQIPALTVDHVSRHGFEVWGPKGLGAWLSRNKIRAASLTISNKSLAASYPSPEQVNQELVNINKAYPQITQLSSIGKSAKGRDLAVMKISSNPGLRNDPRPEFKFIANMHGDEIVGRELMVLLIKDLVTNYGKDAAITKLVDSVQIYIMPSMNPDGADAGTRANAQGVDLNRNFPDFTTNDNQNTLQGRAPETQAVMKWQAAHKFVLSANFHGGAEVVNYMWDTAKENHPQHDLIFNLSLGYAKLAPYISASTEFQNGITNGFEWYEVNGGMQDWSNYWYQDLHFTVELSNQKWPDYGKVPYYYQQNRAAMLDFISKTPQIAQMRKRFW